MSARILVVEDEMAVAEELGHFLSHRGYRVTPACGVGEAIERLDASAFDLVITDIRMPGRDGGELVERLRGNAAATPVIVVTGQIDYDPKASDGTPPTVLRKPVSLRELDRKILDILCKPESLERNHD